MNLDHRDPTVTYKVTHVNPAQLEYSVIRYPDHAEPNYSHALFRFDTLPEWIQDGVRKLDIAGNNTVVPYFGVRRGDTYWFKSVKYSQESGDGETA